ncbi:MAG: PLDc N-terminal domain-containing protein [Actinomycetota bacterium]
MEIGVFILFFGFTMVLAILPLGLLIWALIDLLRRPSWAWPASDQQQIVWVLVVLLVGLIGPIVYMVVAKPKLDEAEARGAPPVPAPPPIPGS